MRTALVMLKKNEEVPPQLRAALDNLATETLPDLLGGIVYNSQENIVRRMEEQYAKSDDDVRSLQARVLDGTVQVESTVEESQKSAVTKINAKLEKLSEILTRIETTLMDSVPNTMKEVVSQAHKESLEQLQAEMKEDRDTMTFVKTFLTDKLPTKMKDTAVQSEEKLTEAIEVMSLKVPDALEGRLQRLRQRILGSVCSELQEMSIKLRADIVREVAQEFDRMQQASDELVAQRLREVALAPSGE